MTPNKISMLAFMWFWCTLICLFIEGAWFGSRELAIANYLTGYNTVDLGGLWGIPRVVIGFFTHGFPALISWDYVFLQGGFAIVRLGLSLTLSAGAVWGLVSAFVTVISRTL